MKKKPLLMITENTIIKLYEKNVWDESIVDKTEICTVIVDEIINNLSKTNKPHPLKELFLDENNRAPFYELVHFVFNTIERYIITTGTKHET